MEIHFLQVIEPTFASLTTIQIYQLSPIFVKEFGPFRCDLNAFGKDESCWLQSRKSDTSAYCLIASFPVLFLLWNYLVISFSIQSSIISFSDSDSHRLDYGSAGLVSHRDLFWQIWIRRLAGNRMDCHHCRWRLSAIQYALLFLFYETLPRRDRPEGQATPLLETANRTGYCNRTIQSCGILYGLK